MSAYETGPGQHIDHASREAIRIATEANENVQFTFNDITLTAMPHGSPAQLSALFSLLCEQRAEAYRNSPKGKAEARARKLELKENQARIDALMLKLADLADLDAAVDWLDEYTTLADDIGVKSHLREVKAALEKAGYVNNEFTGKAFVPGDKRVMGRYIVGQAINCMANGMPPHPVLGRFAQEYREMA